MQKTAASVDVELKIFCNVHVKLSRQFIAAEDVIMTSYNVNIWKVTASVQTTALFRTNKRHRAQRICNFYNGGI